MMPEVTVSRDAQPESNVIAKSMARLTFTARTSMLFAHFFYVIIPLIYRLLRRQSVVFYGRILLTHEKLNAGFVIFYLQFSNSLGVVVTSVIENWFSALMRWRNDIC